MTSDARMVESLYESLGPVESFSGDENTGHIVVHHNRVIGKRLVPGLRAEAERDGDDRLRVFLAVDDGVRIEHPVRICFGMLPDSGRQEIEMDVRMGEESRAEFAAYCTFPNARQVEHRMNATIEVAAGAEYGYLERHVHGPRGGVKVVPHARIAVREGARFKTEFELIRGAVGSLDIDYEIQCAAHAVFEMMARVRGRYEDDIRIRESGELLGEYARGALTSHIAVREQARAAVYNVMRAEAPYARGHVDCKEVVQDRATARAVPEVVVNDPRAHITHEAAIGSVDSRQLQTLMARGMSEDAAADLIIQGMLS